MMQESTDEPTNDRWARLVRELSPPLLLYARTWARQAEAEDLVQQVFVKLMERSTWPDDPRPWLFRCLRNEAISWRRSFRRRLRRERDVLPPHEALFAPGPVGDTAADRARDAEAIQGALARLPSEMREIVVLRIWSELTLREIAELTAMPDSSVHDRYRTALAAMKKQLEKPCQMSQADQSSAMWKARCAR